MSGSDGQRLVCLRTGVVWSNSGSNRRQVAMQIQAITGPPADPSSEPQANFFGAHTSERVDRPAGPWFHTLCPEVIG